jgi:copper chaperone CopZ
MKSIIIMAVLLATATISQAQIKNAQTDTVKVYGNCGMCETTIEKAGSKAKISKTDWDQETGIAVITYDTKKTSLDAVLKNIALSGYDNANYLAPTAVYNKLHGCCKYDRETKTTAVPAEGIQQ